MAVPTGPRAERLIDRDDPFVTPPRGVEASVASATSGPEANVTPTAMGFTPRPDRLAETVSAANAQAVYPPQACVFVAK